MWIPESKRVWQKEGWTVMCLRLLSPASGCGREDRTNSQIVDGSPWFWPFQARAADRSKKRRSTDWPRGYIKSDISDTDPYPTIFILIRNHSTLLSPELAQMEACLDVAARPWKSNTWQDHIFRKWVQMSGTTQIMGSFIGYAVWSLSISTFGSREGL